MRTVLLIFLVAGALFCRGQGFANIHSRDPFYPASEEGEILIKFRDDVKVGLLPLKNTLGTGILSVDDIFNRRQVVSARHVFPGMKDKTPPAHVVRIPGMPPGVLPALHNIFRLRTNDPDLSSLIRELMSDPAVEYAEPNYLVTTMITEPGDALYQSGIQWYLQAIGAPYAWDSVTGDTSQVVGIIDTGIDCDHPDLDGNIWINRGEIPGNGLDDDNNGYVDDVHGWDFRNNDNNPDDDNGHGTHVAGVVGAETDNYIGIAGVSWHSRLMPLKVLSGTGSGSMADLAEAISYAASNGATIINMSLGSYGESQTVKAALLNAYQTLCPVAAAGNDHYKVDTVSPPSDAYAPSFPGCYPFVIGVEATMPDGSLAPFSNFDPSGFSHSWNPKGYNYEVMAPGVEIWSTFPNGGYRPLTGTSMASPVVTGAIALLKSYKPGITNEEIFARLIQFSPGGKLNIPDLLASALNPDLICTNQTLVDTAGSSDNDGIADAGETIDLFLTVKNAGGFADSVWSRLHLAWPGDTSFIRLIDTLSYIGNLDSANINSGIPAYTTLTGERDPFRIFIKPGVANDKIIVLEYEIGARHSFSRTFTFPVTIQNGRELFGVLDTTYTLTPGRLWLVNRSFKITSTGVLNILPGTHLTITNGLINKGVINALGKADSMIYMDGIQGIDCNQGKGKIHFNYTRIQSDAVPFIASAGISTLDHCFFEYCPSPFMYGGFTMKDCVYKDCGDVIADGLEVYRCVYDNSCTSYLDGNRNVRFNNYVGWNLSKQKNEFPLKSPPDFFEPKGKIAFGRNNFSIGNLETAIYLSPFGYPGYYDSLPRYQYWGTTDSIQIDKYVWDFWDNPELPVVLFMPILEEPTDSAHGFVWKVHINGVNPQDGNLDPMGSGNVRFDVYFNKPMDTARVPYLSFGVRSPFTQHVVENNASWRSDRKMWTAWYPVGLETGDGINTIRVSDAWDPDGFRVATERSGRFQFVIQAASSLANDFSATPGIGKIFLEWPWAGTNDPMGFNMYRFIKLNDGTSTDPVLLNSKLITDSTYIDFSANPDTTYGYCYRIVGTDNSESDFSKTVFAKPLSSANGDANGDQAVNVMDITAVISYILEQDPKPFLFEAADLNYDNRIDLLDIVLLTDIILGTKGKNEDSPYDGTPACLDVAGDRFDLVSSGNLAALQLRIEGKNLDSLGLQRCFNDFEYATTSNGQRIIALIFSYDLRKIEAGLRILFKYKTRPAVVNHLEVYGADSDGRPVPVQVCKGIADQDPREEIQINPNPFETATTILATIPYDGAFTMEVIDLRGVVVYTSLTEPVKKGVKTIYWEGLKGERSALKPGIFILKTILHDGSGNELIRTKKMLILAR